MYNHNKAQQSKNRVHISWDILYYQFIFLYLQNIHELYQFSYCDASNSYHSE